VLEFLSLIDGRSFFLLPPHDAISNILCRQHHIDRGISGRLRRCRFPKKRELHLHIYTLLLACLTNKHSSSPYQAPALEDTTSQQRKTFKHACKDGNLLQRLVWRCLRPPDIPDKRIPGHEASNVVSKLLFEWPAHMIWVSWSVARVITKS